MTQLSILFESIKQHIGPLIGSALILISPIKYIMILVGFFIVLDTFFGIHSAKKTKQKITSRKLSRFIGKMLAYQLVIISAYAIGQLLLTDFLFAIFGVKMMVTKIAAIMLIGNEIFSIDEKLKSVNKGNGIWFYFKRMIGAVKDVKKEFADADIESDDFKIK